MAQLHLLPEPRSLTFDKGTFTMPAEMFILLHPDPATRDLFAAERFEIEAESLCETRFRIAVGAESVEPRREIRVVPDAGIGHEQGYRLRIAPEGITLHARTAAGTFYAFQTLLQIVRETAYARAAKGRAAGGLKLPAVTIEDYPDYARRGVYHDTARGKVPTIDTLLQLIDDLGHLKINEFQLYIENNFEFRKHPQMYDDTSPFTAEELLLLDSACRARHIDFVPSLTSLGHFDKILRRPAFRHLAEVEPAELKKQGVETWSEDPWTLCVTDPAAKAFLKDMYDEFVPNFSSPRFNICCDESWDLGKGRSKAAAEALGEKGTTRLYVQWIAYCNHLAREHGKRIQMWGDIILHHPELIAELPPDATLLEWGYESHHAFDEHCRKIAERLKSMDSQTPAEDGDSAGKTARQFYVAPGTASWLSFATRSRNALGNIHNAAAAGLKHGAAGLLVTDWGDYGHQQLLGVSLLPFAYAAGASWNLASTPNPAPAAAPDWSTGTAPRADKALDRALRPFLAAASLHLFHDPSQRFAGLAYDLGLTYERFAWQRFNGSLDWFLFREKFDFANYVNRASEKDLQAVMVACEGALPQILTTDIRHPQGTVLQSELAFTAKEILHTCRRTLLRKQWLAADPAVRNPDHDVLRAKPAVPLPRTFKGDLKKLAKDAAGLERDFTTLWMARNKRSRLEDNLAEFHRLQAEYARFAK